VSIRKYKSCYFAYTKWCKCFSIASLNEWLFYDGYKAIDDSVNFESKLVWTVLVWDFELPVVYNWSESSKTIVPFTDFEDKSYIYNHEKKIYEANDDNFDWLKSEIWHWVISPNTWDFDDNIIALKNYFDKNHDFYSWTWNFKYSEGILSGNKNIWIPSSYEPYVFYFDQIREEKSLNYQKYKAYEVYLQHFEDIIYNRYTKSLANQISSDVLWYSTNEISKLFPSWYEGDKIDEEQYWQDMLDWLIEANSNLPADQQKTRAELEAKRDFLMDAYDEGLSSESLLPDNVPDIQTREVIDNVTKKFVEIYSKGTLWEFRKDVYNAWRYNKWWSKVNVDSIPHLITVLDGVYWEMVKQINDEIEDEIDDLVVNWLSRKITIQTWLETKTQSGSCVTTYVNYLNWKEANDIEQASECSIYRWSVDNWWKLVEANRWYNVNLIENDKAVFDDDAKVWNSTYCYGKFTTTSVSDSPFNWRWGGNSPLNLDLSTSGEMTLKNSDLWWAITPLFDIWWSKEVKDESKEPYPRDCENYNMILTHQEVWDERNSQCRVVYSIPEWLKDWTCTTINKKTSGSGAQLESVFWTTAWQCEEISISIAWANGWDYTYSNAWPTSSSWWETCSVLKKVYNYKAVDSYIKHKSPTYEELQKQIRAKLPPDLPIDKNRYIDFVSAKWDESLNWSFK